MPRPDDKCFSLHNFTFRHRARVVHIKVYDRELRSVGWSISYPILNLIHATLSHNSQIW